jgi:CheY-like chemotaxis protein
MAVIAVVNDDTAFIGLMSDLLKDEGYETIPHKVGDTAYAMIRDKQPDLVVLDIRLEHRDSGLVTLDLMRLDPRTAHIPVIICSADARFLRDKEAHFRAKGCLSIEKPFNLEELLALVDQALAPVGTSAAGSR